MEGSEPAQASASHLSHARAKECYQGGHCARCQVSRPVVLRQSDLADCALYCTCHLLWFQSVPARVSEAVPSDRLFGLVTSGHRLRFAWVSQAPVVCLGRSPTPSARSFEGIISTIRESPLIATLPLLSMPRCARANAALKRFWHLAVGSPKQGSAFCLQMEERRGGGCKDT